MGEVLVMPVAIAAPVGKNATGEDCRVRLVQIVKEPADFHRFSLAQGFFYAGARALLVSHWAVASRATVLLTTGMFSVYTREPAAGRAEALRRSHVALAGEAATSHPFFWAPVVLVGDGGPAGP
jgi:protein-S-isoprenylcysteine O-methyltransferase Ste14